MVDNFEINEEFSKVSFPLIKWFETNKNKILMEDFNLEDFETRSHLTEPKMVSGELLSKEFNTC